MLRTLIVDDEKLVRSEMRKLTDWSKFQIKIVGEAENGNEALRFLEKHPVHLMISDLSMPGLSGIEFLKVVRERFPQVRIVVMTMYQDFELVQQAMRLGAVDYITKTQIEKNRFDEILNNILKRLSSIPGESSCVMDDISVYWRFSPGSFPIPPGFEKLEEDLYIGPVHNEPPFAGNTLNLRFSGAFGMMYRQVISRVRECIATRLFYEFSPGCRVYSFAFEMEPVPTAKMRDETAARLRSTEWLLDNACYGEIVQSIPTMFMTPEELSVYLYQAFLTSASFFHWEPGEYFAQTESLSWWFQWRQWLNTLRNKTAALLCSKDSPQFAVQKAVAYMERHFHEEICLQDILNMTAMSKSRFSYFFKEQTGQTFVNYLKRLRVERAKKLLTETNQPVCSIGDKTGYPDERYFRRVFMEFAGCTPVQYRKMMQKTE